MLSKVKSVALQGLEGFCIDVEADISTGLPSLDIVGLPDISIKEAKERVKVAIKNSGYDFLSRKIIINLAPANLRKEGSTFDLAIAISILSAAGIINNSINDNTIFIGELSLDGNINKVNGILPMCIEAQKYGMNTVILPRENSGEAEILEGMTVVPVQDLRQVVGYLNNEIIIETEKRNFIEYTKINKKYQLDFSDVKGQRNVKRALEVATSGGHNCMLIGSPGSGKTMMAQRVPSILPDLNFKETLEITKIHSLTGNLGENNIVLERPFRNPHHTVTPISLVGGGRNPRPGEISLAHYGVLFLDELPEFNRSSLEVLRGPLEDNKITISRINSSVTYPCNFMLICSLNPCPCGYYGSDKPCTCSMEAIRRYLGKISGPLLDRIDIQIEVSNVNYNELQNGKKEESSEIIRNRVNKSREIQRKRYINDLITMNSELTPKLIEKYCELNNECKKIIEKYFDKLGLSVRGYNKILKVARTIADMEESTDIEKDHILEAIQYRSLDKKYTVLIK